MRILDFLRPARLRGLNFDEVLVRRQVTTVTEYCIKLKSIRTPQRRREIAFVSIVILLPLALSLSSSAGDDA